MGYVYGLVVPTRYYGGTIMSNKDQSGQKRPRIDHDVYTSILERAVTILDTEFVDEDDLKWQNALQIVIRDLEERGHTPGQQSGGSVGDGGGEDEQAGAVADGGQEHRGGKEEALAMLDDELALDI